MESIESKGPEYSEINNFDKLSEMVRSRKVRIRLIVANPRTSSTLLETSLAQNEMIDTVIHEPFSNTRGKDNNDGYGRILTKIGNLQPTNKPINVAVKEIARNLTDNNANEKLLSIIEDPPLILIRNSLLTAESKIRAILRGLGTSTSSHLRKILSNSYSSLGMQGLTTDPDRIYLQRELLNNFARSKGYDDWDLMLSAHFETQDYGPFEEILEDDRIFRLESPASFQIMQDLESASRPFIVIDSTDLKLDPGGVLENLSKKWKLPFSGKMVRWGRMGKKVVIEQSQMDEWYKEVIESDGINDPSELSPSLTDFPRKISEHLRDVEIPIYGLMSQNPNIIRAGAKSLIKNIQLIKGINPNRLEELGIISCPDTFPPSLRISDIDPVFYLLAHRKAIYDREFLETNRSYMSVFELLGVWK